MRTQSRHPVDEAVHAAEVGGRAREEPSLLREINLSYNGDSGRGVTIRDGLSRLLGRSAVFAVFMLALAARVAHGQQCRAYYWETSADRVCLVYACWTKGREWQMRSCASFSSGDVDGLKGGKPTPIGSECKEFPPGAERRQCRCEVHGLCGDEPELTPTPAPVPTPAPTPAPPAPCGDMKTKTLGALTTKLADEKCTQETPDETVDAPEKVPEQASSRCSSFWPRARTRFEQTNRAIWGWTVPFGTSFLASGYTAKALETTTPLRFIVGGFRGMTLAGASFTRLETAVIAGTTSAVNYILVSGAFEAGIGLSSLGGAAGDELADFIFGCPP